MGVVADTPELGKEVGLLLGYLHNSIERDH
jgi:hypothetical protein